jgi:hypothetical protein
MTVASDATREPVSRPALTITTATGDVTGPAVASPPQAPAVATPRGTTGPAGDLRPVYHRLEERIRAHVILCWLVLLLVRVVETTTGTTWHQQRQHLDELHIGTFTAATGTYRQRTELT